MPICPFIGLSVYWRRPSADLSVYRFIGLSAQAGADLSVYRFIGLSAQAGADLSVYRFIGLSAQAGKNRPCHHAGCTYKAICLSTAKTYDLPATLRDGSKGS